MSEKNVWRLFGTFSLIVVFASIYLILEYGDVKSIRIMGFFLYIFSLVGAIVGFKRSKEEKSS